MSWLRFSVLLWLQDEWLLQQLPVSPSSLMMGTSFGGAFVLGLTRLLFWRGSPLSEQ
jgi:hypothetical protein